MARGDAWPSFMGLSRSRLTGSVLLCESEQGRCGHERDRGEHQQDEGVLIEYPFHPSGLNGNQGGIADRTASQFRREY